MEEEYDIPMEEQLKEDLVDMCNLSKGVTERAEARGEARGEVKGEAKGIINTSIRLGVPESDIIKNLQEDLNVTLKQAQEYFKMYGKKTV
jgi:hypothetical protein